MSGALETVDVCLDEIRLEVRTWPGTGIPILMLHEGLGSVGTWRDFPARLARATGRRVVAWSRQGHGGSDPLPAPRLPDYMHREAMLVPRLMDKLGIGRAILFGHSDGASIALITAARAPERVAALILEAPHVFIEPLTLASIAAARDTFRSGELGAKLARHHRSVDTMFWRWNDIWLDPAFADWNIEEELAAIDAPTLLIQGLDDEYGTLAQLDRIEGVLARVQRVELERCGHAPHRDQRDTVLMASAAFAELIPG